MPPNYLPLKVVDGKSPSQAVENSMRESASAWPVEGQSGFIRFYRHHASLECQSVLPCKRAPAFMGDRVRGWLCIRPMARKARSVYFKVMAPAGAFPMGDLRRGAAKIRSSLMVNAMCISF